MARRDSEVYGIDLRALEEGTASKKKNEPAFDARSAISEESVTQSLPANVENRRVSIGFYDGASNTTWAAVPRGASENKWDVYRSSGPAKWVKEHGGSILKAVKAAAGALQVAGAVTELAGGSQGVAKTLTGIGQYGAAGAAAAEAVGYGYSAVGPGTRGEKLVNGAHGFAVLTTATVNIAAIARPEVEGLKFAAMALQATVDNVPWKPAREQAPENKAAQGQQASGLAPRQQDMGSVAVGQKPNFNDVDWIRRRATGIVGPNDAASTSSRSESPEGTQQPPYRVSTTPQYNMSNVSFAPRNNSTAPQSPAQGAAGTYGPPVPNSGNSARGASRSSEKATKPKKDRPTKGKSL
ncbi:hypothetical protein ACIQM0_26950 [Streptomyces sp. NPDC091387]|uniref:hypothetical protein n=1 Tax=Streptomyces sp. NPDC091387 TaxID=3365998 RepID=UPI00380E96C9